MSLEDDPYYTPPRSQVRVHKGDRWSVWGKYLIIVRAAGQQLEVYDNLDGLRRVHLDGSGTFSEETVLYHGFEDGKALTPVQERARNSLRDIEYRKGMAEWLAIDWENHVAAARSLDEGGSPRSWSEDAKAHAESVNGPADPEARDAWELERDTEFERLRRGIERTWGTK